MANVLFSLGNSNNVGLLVCISELFGADSEQSSHRWSKDSEGTQCRDSNDQWLVFFLHGGALVKLNPLDFGGFGEALVPSKVQLVELFVCFAHVCEHKTKMPFFLVIC